MSELLDKKLQSFDYYLSKIPFYLRQSAGFSEHFKIWFDLLISSDSKSIVGTFDTLLNLFDIFNVSGYWTDREYPIDSEQVTSILKLLTKLYDVNIRPIVNQTQLNLTNQDILTLIKLKILKSNYDGSFQQMKAYYELAGLVVAIASDRANCLLIFQQTTDLTTNIAKLFLSRDESVILSSTGITYQIIIGQEYINNYAKWDDVNAKWDSKTYGWSV